MKTIHTHAKHTEWLSADEMHFESKKWLSELEFYKEEQWFFEDLIRTYTLQILDHNHFDESKRLIDKLTKIVEQTQTLLKAVKSHEKELSIMVDGIDQIKEEKAYKKEHRNLTELVDELRKRYRTLKAKFFKFIKMIMKESKENHLIEKK
jgi:polyhydroxyalkanoate synthesis regulator phasin